MGLPTRDPAGVSGSASAARKPATHADGGWPAPGGDPVSPPAVDAVETSQLAQSIERLNARLLGAGTALRFSVAEESGATVIRIVDRETQEVVRQIPPQELINVVQALRELHADGGAVSGLGTSQGAAAVQRGPLPPLIDVTA